MKGPTELKPTALLHATALGLLDAIGGLIGRPPRLLPLAGPPGTVALLTTPDVLDNVLNQDKKYPDWQQTVAARSTFRLGLYRPGRDASQIRSPLLVVVADQDRSALAAPAVEAAQRALHAELVRVGGGHYAPFTNAHEEVVAAELSSSRPQRCRPGGQRHRRRPHSAAPRPRRERTGGTLCSWPVKPSTTSRLG